MKIVIFLILFWWYGIIIITPSDYFHVRLPVNPNIKNPTVLQQCLILTKNYPQQELLMNLIKHESRFDPAAVHNNGKWGRDRGILQINNKYHHEVSDACAYDLKCSLDWGMWMIDSGHANEWSSYKYLNN
jgi:hypothetical protein